MFILSKGELKSSFFFIPFPSVIPAPATCFHRHKLRRARLQQGPSPFPSSLRRQGSSIKKESYPDISRSLLPVYTGTSSAGMTRGPGSLLEFMPV